MRNLRFHYFMKLEFDTPVKNHRFTLKCTPQSDSTQLIHNMEINIYPNKFLDTDIDSFGNKCIYGYSDEEHTQFYIDVSGNAVTGMHDASEPVSEIANGFYRYQTECTKPGDAIKAFYRKVGESEDKGSFETAVYYMNALHAVMKYDQNATHVGTTAEESMRMMAGVCQDYSHIMLSLCRMKKIPCRYVVGMLLGEGASHAWIEVLDNGSWKGIDPVNNILVDDQHIKISCGRDYKDCRINTGVFMGLARQRQTVNVLVEEQT